VQVLGISADAAAKLAEGGFTDESVLAEVGVEDIAPALGGDEAVFLIRPNAGLPFAPVAETCCWADRPLHAGTASAAIKTGTVELLRKIPIALLLQTATDCAGPRLFFGPVSVVSCLAVRDPSSRWISYAP